MRIGFLTLIILIIVNGAYAVADAQDALPPHFLEYFEGTTGNGECSGSVVKFNDDKSAAAIVLTNGHCIEGSIPVGGFVAHRHLRGRHVAFFSVGTADGKTIRVYSHHLLFATKYKTDIALYETDTSYAELERQGIRAFTLSKYSARPGDQVDMVSLEFMQLQYCTVGRLVHELRTAWSDTFNAYRYERCESFHGWSGAPLLLHGTREIVGVNNSHFGGGTTCGTKEPCEIDQAGQITFGPEGASYGQQTALILTCITPNGRFNLKVAGCELGR